MKLPNKINEILLKILEYLEKKKKVRLLGVLLFLIFAIIFRESIVEFITIVILYVLASVSVLYKRLGNIPIGFELISFTFIVLTFAYNPIFAIIMVILISITSRILTACLDPTFFIQIGLYALLGFLSLFVMDLGIVVGGIILVIIYNILKRIIYIFAIGYDPITNIIAGTLNIIINYFLLVRLGPFVLGLLS